MLGSDAPGHRYCSHSVGRQTGMRSDRWRVRLLGGEGLAAVDCHYPDRRRGAGSVVCSFQGREYPCHDAAFGWFDSTLGCYFSALTPQLAYDSKLWEGHPDGQGAIYQFMCPTWPGTGISDRTVAGLASARGTVAGGGTAVEAEPGPAP